MLGRILILVWKELLAVWRDRKSRAMLILPPLLQLVVFSFAATEEVRNIHLGVLNEDWGLASRTLVERFAASPSFASVQILDGAAELRQAIDTQAVLLALHIGPTFSRDLAAGRSPAVELILDGRRSNATQIAASYAASMIDAYAAEQSAPARHRSGLQGTIITRSWFNPNLDSLWSTVPGLLPILTMLIGLVVTGLSVARERELGTFEQLLVAPFTPFEILLGKTVPALLIGLAEGTAIVAVAILLFRVPFTGSFALLYLGMATYLAAVVGVGLFISSLVSTQQQAVLGAFTFMAPAILLSGFASPIENMPPWLQQLTLVNPARFFLVIVKGEFLKAMPAAEVAANLWPLALIALATLTSAAWFFRRGLP